MVGGWSGWQYLIERRVAKSTANVSLYGYVV
jgi:hypothetical protein